MIKILIVEDKPPILWSIKQKIENYSTEIEVVGEAHNGMEALSLIEQLKPDIVFTDIRMPVMDGLKLIAEVKKTHMDIHFVIISGYDEFEYARQAIKLGVSDYILKPVTQETINEILDKITVYIKARASQHKKKILQEILNLGSSKVMSNKDFSCQYFFTVLFCAGSFSNHVIDYTNPNNFLWSKINCSELVSGHLPRNVFSWCFDGKSLNEMILLLGITQEFKFDVSNVIEPVNSKLLSSNIPVTIAVSKRIGSINDIGIETQNTRMFLRKNLILGKPGIIFTDTSNSGTNEKNTILDAALEKKLTTFIQSNQKTLFLNEIRKIADYWERNNYKQYNIENSLKYIAYLCNKIALEEPDFSSDFKLEIEEILCIAKDYPALLQGMNSFFSQFFPESADSRQKREPMKEIVEKVKNYIKSNYAKQITINDIADMVNVDPCYLSKTFKNLKGISPMEYLTNLRIEKSKDLIMNDSGLMLKDIADIVGYANQYYFSRIFKIVTGLSPSEFKNSKQTAGLDSI